MVSWADRQEKSRQVVKWADRQEKSREMVRAIPDLKFHIDCLSAYLPICPPAHLLICLRSICPSAHCLM
jgi:hypothetical protein